MLRRDHFGVFSSLAEFLGGIIPDTLSRNPRDHVPLVLQRPDLLLVPWCLLKCFSYLNLPFVPRPMPYTAIHDTPPYYGNLPAQTIPRYPSTPRYGSPDIDPSVNIYTKMSDGSDGSDQYNGHQYQQQTYQAHSNGVSSSQAASSAPAFQPRSSRTQGESRHSAEAGQTNSAEGSRKRPRPEDEDRSHAHQAPMPSGSRFIHGSFFGMTARNPVTREIGDFLLNNCKGRNDVEVEIKLGQISTPVEIGQRWKRISLPALTELSEYSSFEAGGDKGGNECARNWLPCWCPMTVG